MVRNGNSGFVQRCRSRRVRRMRRTSSCSAGRTSWKPRRFRSVVAATTLFHDRVALLPVTNTNRPALMCPSNPRPGCDDGVGGRAEAAVVGGTGTGGGRAASGSERRPR